MLVARSNALDAAVVAVVLAWAACVLAQPAAAQPSPAPSDAAGAGGGWREARGTYYGAPEKFARAYDPSRYTSSAARAASLLVQTRGDSSSACVQIDASVRARATLVHRSATCLSFLVIVSLIDQHQKSGSTAMSAAPFLCVLTAVHTQEIKS